MVNNPTCPLGSSKRTAAECGTEASTRSGIYHGDFSVVPRLNQRNQPGNKLEGPWVFWIQISVKVFSFLVNKVFGWILCSVFLGGGKIHKVDFLVVEMVEIYFGLNFRGPFSSHKSWILCDFHIHEYLRTNSFSEDSQFYRNWLIRVTAEDKTHH